MRSEESHALHDRDTDRIKALTDKLHVTQNLLYDSTKDYLDLKYEYRAKERDWMTEKDQLLRQLDHCREQMDVSEGVDPVLGMSIPGGDARGPRGATAKHLHLQLKQAQQLADNYREQCIAMEEDMCKLREETEASKGLFKQRSEKMSKRLGLMNSRYEALERKRALEIEGYKNDIKLLRQRLKEVEKQLYKVYRSSSCWTGNAYLINILCGLCLALSPGVEGSLGARLACSQHKLTAKYNSLYMYACVYTSTWLSVLRLCASLAFLLPHQ